MYSAIGISPVFIFTTAERGFNLIKSDKIQAEGYRTSMVGDSLGDQYKLNMPLSKVKVAIFCMKKAGCNFRADQNYAIQYGFHYGKIICNALKIRCVYEKTQKGVAKLLDRGLADGVISPYPAYSKYLCISNSDKFYFKNLPDYYFNIYHYTNISDDQLRLELEESLQTNLNKYSSLFSKYKSKPNLNNCNKALVRI